MRSSDECRCDVEQLLADHRRLHVLLRDARSAILGRGGPVRNVTAANVESTLRLIQSEFLHHIAEEEASGCLEAVATRCPRLSAQVRRSQAEHPDLAHVLDKLIGRAVDYKQSTESRIAFERDFVEFCERLHAHEAAENDLLRQAFSTNDNSDDNEERTLTFGHECHSGIGKHFHARGMSHA
jgi:hypothetical protein